MAGISTFFSNRTRCQCGFTLIEMLVSVFLLTVVMSAIFSFLWGASRYWQTGQETADVTENARMGLNRMTRELKQSSQITVADTDQVVFDVDFGDTPDGETVTYGFTPGTNGDPGTVWRSSTVNAAEITMINDVDDAQFVYYGNDYRCDTDGDGLVTMAELQGCSASPLTQISRVDVVLTMRSGDSVQQTFVGQAWLRNRSTIQGA